MPKYNKKMAYDKSSDYNMQYKSNIKGANKMQVMQNHGNTYPIATTSPQKRDMGRMDISPMEYKGYADQAFDYKY